MIVYNNVYLPKSTKYESHDISINTIYWILSIYIGITKWMFAIVYCIDKNGNYLIIIILFVFLIAKFILFGYNNIKNLVKRQSNILIKLLIFFIGKLINK